MVFEDNFIQVTDRVMIDPNLKIVLQQGLLNFDTVTQTINLDYDPEIRADRLMVPMTEEEKRSYGVSPGPEGHLWPFRSGKRINLADYIFGFRPNYFPGHLIIELSTNDFEKKSKYISGKSNFLNSSDLPNFCINILKVITRMQTWYNLVKKYNKNPANLSKNIHCISFLISLEMDNYINRITGENFKRISDTHCLFASREVQP